MKKIIFLMLFCLFLIPIVKADGMPYPYIRPQIREEHQIVLMELKDNKIITTLDLGIRNRPETILPILDNSIYISENSPFWLKTFLLPTDFEPKELCVNSYDFGYYWTENSPVKIIINGNILYLYTPMKCTNHAQCSQACDDVGTEKWQYSKRWQGTCPENVYGCMTRDCCLGQCLYKTTGECICQRTNKVDIYGDVCPSGTTCGSDCYCHPVNETKTVITGAAAMVYSQELIRMPPQKTQTYCQLMLNEKNSNPQFVNISSYLKPGEYNTIEIRSNIQYRSFSLNKIYIASETKELVKIIIPFKTMPESVEVGGYGLDTMSLDQPFTKEKRYWYGYYGGNLLSEKEMPLLASTAQRIEESVKSQVIQTQVATDVTGGFQGKVLNVISQASLSEASYTTKGLALSLQGVTDIESVYQGYIQDNAYVIELKILPYELKRITVKWVEDLSNANQFQYYYPLGTGRTWLENISYTAIYIKLPQNYILTYANIPGKDDAKDASYNYYRWKFVETKPMEDLIGNFKKISEIESFVLSTYVPIIGLIAFVVIIFVISRIG